MGYDMRKFLFSLLIIISIFSFSMFTACSGNEEDSPVGEVVITVSDTDVYLEVGESTKINYAVTGTDNTSAKWKSSDTSICTVDGGNLVGIKEGEATISLTIDGETTTVNVTVFEYQKETADVYTTPVEVYDYCLEGEVIANDFTLVFAEYGMQYNKNAKAKFVKGDKEIDASVRVSSDKTKLFVRLDALGAKNYGEGYSLIVSSADKMVEIPIDTIVTKFISEKDDLHNLFYFGDMEFNSEFCLYDGYFVQTTDIDMECIPLLNRLPYESYNTERYGFIIDKDNPEITGKIQIGKQGETPLYAYFNVDAGFMGVYDGSGYSIINISLYDDQGGYPRARQAIAGLFGNIGREGVVKNLGVTATDTWTWYSYGSTHLLAYSINGTLENVYCKITPTLYVESETRPNSSVGHTVTRVISGATLKNVVFELDIPDELIREYKADDIVESKGKANYTNQYRSAFSYNGFDAAYAKNNNINIRKETNTYENCYFFYTGKNSAGVYGTYGFECYDYENIPNKTFDIIEESEYFELNSNGAPVFRGLGH